MNLHHGSMPTILVCDEDEIIRASIYEYFSHQGYEVLLAKSSAECLKSIKEGRPDAIVLDINIFKIMGALKELGSETPVLLLGSKEELRLALSNADLCISQWVAKPLELVHLAVLIQKSLREAQYAKEENFF